MLDVGLPAGGEFALMFIYMGVIYWVISDFGAAAQAGFGIGSRIMQSIFMPAMAIAFAAGPIAGQNFGAKQGSRVRETFAKALMLNTVVMVLVTVFLQWRPEALVGFFTAEAEAQAVGATFLRIISWTFIAQGIVFTCSGVFQGLGNTIPAMLSSGDSPRGVRAARRLAGRAARVPSRRGLVAVGLDGLAAGHGELPADAPAVQAAAGRRSAAGRRGRRARRELAQRRGSSAVRLGRRSRYHRGTVEEQLRRQSCAHDYSLV